MSNELKYLSGFGNEFESEAAGYAGAVPRDLINPQRCKFDLFAEQLSGSAFTAPRATNRRSWLYRMGPSVGHTPFRPLDESQHGIHFEGNATDPNQKRWLPFECSRMSAGATQDFVQGLRLLAFSDESGTASSSVAIYIYLANQSMDRKSFVNSDGDFLIVPQEGTIELTTEFGKLSVEPNEIAVVQQGMKFSVASESKFFRGYLLEVRGNHFELPYLGPIGANCLANPRDFLIPVARLDPSDKIGSEHQIVLKFQNHLFIATQPHSPYDVAGWFGNYTPYKYHLSRFVTINTVSVDHPDPSIFTVLTCPSQGKPGTAIADFVIFPPRWECARDTFRPPYYHRNCMTEFMGLIVGQYQAKGKEFAPGGGSLHQSMIPHGPDRGCFEAATSQDTCSPKRVADGTMAFMFETSFPLKLSKWASENNVDADYYKCWQHLRDVLEISN